MKSFSQFTARFLTALALGSIAPAAVAVAASPAPQVAVAPAKSKLVIVDSAIATGVENRKPIGGGESFDASVGALYGFVKVKNLGEPTTITMVWKHEGKKKLSVDLAVGHSIHWATWSKKGIVAKSAGNWTVDVLDAEGTLVDTLAFTVTGSSTVGSK